ASATPDAIRSTEGDDDVALGFPVQRVVAAGSDDGRSMTVAGGRGPRDGRGGARRHDDGHNDERTTCVSRPQPSHLSSTAASIAETMERPRPAPPLRRVRAGSAR